MTRARQHLSQILELSRRAATAVLVLTIMCMLTIVATQPAQAQTFSVVHSFSGGAEGGGPAGGLAIDGGGNLYGATEDGPLGYGGVYKLKLANGTISPLYQFTGAADGAYPNGVVIGPNGTLYGNAHGGGLQMCTGAGGNPGCGVVFNLRPPARACTTALCPWAETAIYRFMPGGVDAANPAGDPVFDQSGVLYGATEFGGGVNCNGGAGCGTVFKLVPSGDSWTESVLYGFTRDGVNGFRTYAGVVLDKSGNLYGTNYWGPTTGCTSDVGCGTVYELTPSGSGWTQKTLYPLQGPSDGGHPIAGVIFDNSGNLYGATAEYGTGGGGTVFQLTPSGSNWVFHLLQSFSSTNSLCGPQWNLLMDPAGNLYGTTYCDGANNLGNVWELSPSGGGWTYKSLHEFTGAGDGGYPDGGLVFDRNGNLYGTAYGGGASGHGVVWEITFP